MSQDNQAQGDYIMIELRLDLDQTGLSLELIYFGKRSPAGGL